LHSQIMVPHVKWLCNISMLPEDDAVRGISKILHHCVMSSIPAVWSRDSSVGIATGYGLDCQVSKPGRGVIFHFSTTSRQALGAYPASYPMGTGDVSPGIKRLGREAYH
jgi:hypothetical protein